MCGCSFLISSDLYLFKSFEFMDSAPWTAERKLVIKMNKALKDTELAFLLTSSKSEEISRWRRLYRAISLQVKSFFQSPQLFIRTTNVLASYKFNKKQKEAL